MLSTPFFQQFIKFNSSILMSIMKQITVLAFLVLFFVSCAVKPPIGKLKMPEREVVSSLEIPITLSKSKLEEILNERLPTILYETPREDENKILIERNGHLEFNISEDVFRYKIPVKGKAEMQWKFEANTSLIEYHWVEKPRISLGGIGLSSEKLGNLIVNQSKAYVIRELDQQMEKMVDPQTIVSQMWKKLHNSGSLGLRDSLYFNIKPTRISLARIHAEKDKVHSHISIGMDASISTSRNDLITPLAPFNWEYPKRKNSHVLITARMSAITLTEALRESYVGEVFTYGKRKFKIEDIHFFTSGGYIIFNIRTSGSYNGRIKLTGKPVYYTLGNLIKLEDIRYELQGGNVFTKTIEWMFRKRIMREIEASSTIKLDKGKYRVNELLKENLNQIALPYDMNLFGEIVRVEFEHAIEDDNNISVDFGLIGTFEVLLPK
jgi:hypothetical protein